MYVKCRDVYKRQPKDYGFEYADKTELEGGDATVNAEITRRVLGGEPVSYTHLDVYKRQAFHLDARLWH